MASNIVKHRRGTTQEWLEIDLIPENGELVVEECADGTRKCKIGNGLYSFTKLPYVDDATRVQLLDELDKLRDDFADKLEKASTSIEGKLAEQKRVLEASISDTKTTLNEAILEASNKAAGDVQTKLNKVIDDAQKALQADITAIEADVEAKLDAVAKSSEKAHMDISNAISEATSAVKTSLTKDIEDAASVLDDKITLESATRNIQLKNLEGAITTVANTVEEHIQPTIQQIDEKHSKAIEDLDAKHTNSVEQLAVSVDSNVAELAEQIKSQGDAFDKKLSKTAGTIVADYGDKIKNVTVSLEEKIKEVSEASAEAVSAVKVTLNADITDKESALLADIAALKDELLDADKVIQEAVDKLKEQEQAVSDSTAATIQELHNKVKELEDGDTAIREAFEAADTNIITDVQYLVADLADVQQRHTADHTRLLSELARIEKVQSVADSALNDSFLDALAKVYLELADLVEDDLLILSRVFSSEVRLRDELIEVKTKQEEDLINLSARLDVLKPEIEETVSTTLQTTKETITADLTALRNAVNASVENIKLIYDVKIQDNASAISLLENSLKDYKETNEAHIATVERSVTTAKSEASKATKEVKNQADALELALADVNTELDTQSQRISRLMTLRPGTSTGDAEVLDIRSGYNGIEHLTAGDAVRAVGEDVNKLRNSLSQYIDTQAIDGLHYDYAGEVGLMQPYMLYLKAKDEVIPESGVQIISGAGGGGGGNAAASSLKIGYITTSPVIATTTDKVIIKFTFTGADGSGDTILQANAMWKVNGSTVEYGTVKDGENEFDVTKYLAIGTTKVLLTVTDDTGTVATKTWSIQQLELSVDSSFDDRVTYPANEEIIFNYTPQGAIEKTAVFILDGKELDRIILSSDISGREARTILPPQKHGSHLLEFYLEAEINGEHVSSEHKTKDILWYDSTASTPVISTQNPTIKMKQYSTASVVYTVYDPTEDNPEVTILVDGKEVSKAVIKPNPKYNNTPTDVYSYTESMVGSHTVKIVCGSAIKEIDVEVEELGINISPITTGLAFDFNPAGRSNADTANRLWEHNGVKLSVSDNFDWTNGGYIANDPEGPCFCIKAGSTATIDYKLFADDAKRYGKEFKLIFKTTNVANPDAVFLSCVDSTTDKDHIGISMGVHEALIYGQSGSLDIAYSEGDVIEFEFNISKNTEKVPMVMGYEDGVPSRPMVYDSTYSFTQNDPQIITIGSPDCDVYIYRFKVYNTSLSNVDILNNFIADARTAEAMISRYTRNQIYDENNKLTPETLAEKCPWLRVYKLSAPHFTNNKSDKVGGTTIQQLYKNGDPVLDNWTCYNAQHSGQGTSSNNYGASGRNLDFIMNVDGAYFELGDGTTTDKISLTRTSVPNAYLNAKVNIASSNNMTNAILANRFNEFNPYRRPFVARDGVNTAHIKDTMEFHNCVIFFQETDPDMTTHREFADNNWHFYAIGNIGDSKKTDNSRATDPGDLHECCVEIMDVGLPLSDFPTNTMIDAMGYKIDETTEEKIYTWATNDNLGILYELIDGEYILTSDTEVDYNKTYYVDILEHDDFSEDYTYGWRYLKNKKDKTAVAYCKQKWIEFYRFVTTSTDEEFKNHLSDYFVVDSALYYYLFTTRYCMVDNRAKNTFWHYGKTDDGSYKWDLCWDYDNDTSLGLNNYGKQVYRYGLEDIDKDEAGEEVFRESDSQFFCRVRDLFGSELKAMYKDLESKNAWHAESFINKCDKWQEEFPEELWRLDIDRKYIRTYTSSFINGKGDNQFLVNMCNGRMKYHRRQWERSQEQYMASKYQTARAYSDEYHANFRVNRFDDTSDMVIKPNYQLTLTPYSYIYLNVWYGDVSRTPFSIRAVPNQPTQVPCPSALEADIINVGNASAIRDFGDLSACYPKTASVGNASRIKTLTLGNETTGYDNNAFTTLTTGANPLLEELDVENISSLNQSLDLSQLTNLKTVKAYGTNIPSAIFAEGGKMQYAELPAVTSITLKNLNYLSTANIKVADYNNVTALTIENCPLIDQPTIFNKCSKLLKVRLIGVNFGYVTYDFFESKMFKLKGITATGEDMPNAALTGEASFAYLTGAQFDELRERYPNLVIKYDRLDSTITFKGTDLVTTVHDGIAVNAADYPNPVYYGEYTRPSEIPSGMIAPPAKDATAEFTFTFIGWSTEKNIILPEIITDDSEYTLEELIKMYKEDSVKRVEGNRTLYPVFKTTRRSYPVRFFNPTVLEGDDLLQTVQTPYGSDASYTAATPIKLDAASPELYAFSSWYPKPEKITGPLDCYAQFAILDDKWYTIGINDITDCVDYKGNVFDGYSVNEPNKTVSISECNNKFNPAVKIPEQIDILRENITPNVDLVIQLENTAYNTISFDYKFSSGTELCFALFNKEADKYYGSYVLNDVNTFEIYEGVSVNENVNGYYRVTLDIGALTKTNDNLDLENAPTAIDSIRFLSAASDVTGFVDHVQVSGPAGEKTFLVSNYTVTSLGGFSDHTSLELVSLPNTLTEIQSRGFYNCYCLFELDLPDSLETIGRSAFQGCSKIKKVLIPAKVTSIGEAAFADCLGVTAFEVAEGNPRYIVDKDCLIDNNNKTLLQGLSTGSIPSYIKNLGQHCFSNTNITSVKIPEGITTVPNNAFSRCGKLYSVSFPSTLRVLDATCFAWCSDLGVVRLNSGLQDIRTYVFNSCKLSAVTIPASVNNVLERSFGDMPTLRSVTFESGSSIPYIHANAFVNSGSEDEQLVFNLPWSAEDTPNAPWGAINAKLNFNYVEGANND